jgi:CheY-like chemotaxis protein
MTIHTDPFHFLHGILNILVIDGDTKNRQAIIEPFLSSIRCCTVDYTESNTGALGFLRSGRRFHVCITELGMNDIDNDEYVIIRQYSPHCSILVLTGEKSPAKGAMSILLGARAVFDKNEQLDHRTFMSVFNRMALINVVNCRYNEWSGDTLNNATKILFEKNPGSVTEWAEYMRITDRQLRNLWHSGSGFGAKQMLFLYGCLNNALLFYESMSFNGEHGHAAADKYFRKQFEHYFEEHRDVLLYLLS